MPPDVTRPDPYRELFERSADAILIIEGETFVDCNQATVEMLRYRSRAEVLSTHPSDLSPPTQPDGRLSYDKANEMIALAFAKGSHRFEWNHRRADGDVFPVEVLLTAVSRDDKDILHVVWRDITERKRLEEQLRHSQRMEAIGKLAGGIAHDFNNLLVSILSYSEILTEQLTDPRQNEAATEILRAGARAAELVKRLLAFSRKQDLEPAVVDLSQSLDEVDRLLERLIGEHIHLATQAAPGELLVKIDPGQLERMVVNLVTNARDAMPEGGTLTVALSRVDAADGPHEGALAPGEYALLTVTDTGIGMDPQTAQHVFEPFFTTKPVGEGTGLGLSTVYGVATQNGGIASIRTTLGSGTSVDVFLPLTTEPVTPRVADAATPLVVTGTETILVVEDDEAVSRLIAEVLRHTGYTVLLARNGREGLEIFTKRAHDIDLVFSDVVMPIMGGPEMVRRLGELGHQPQILFASGYTNDALSTPDDGPIDILEKPFSHRDLLARIRRALGQANGAQKAGDS